MSDSPEVVARVEEGLELVDMCVRQLRRQVGPHASYEDLVGHGREALLLAARSFDHERGIPFRRWANLRIRGALIDALRAQGNLPKRVWRKLRALRAADQVHDAALEEQPPASAEEADAKLSTQLESAAAAMALAFITIKSGDALDAVTDPDEDPEERVGHEEVMRAIREAISERPEAERQLLQRHYFDDVTFDEVARELGLSKSWASRLHARAIEGVAKTLKRGRIAGP